MNTQVKELFEQARKLSEDERIELADLLYAETAIPYAEWEAAWPRRKAGWKHIDGVRCRPLMQRKSMRVCARSTGSSEGPLPAAG